ncbi:hypothetical protein CRC_01114 [Cylindrospermopsis raciborskii CS-505]|nr:hypothetical protein CRC_01114 [Cylindrospermopsis raciborskii CS-505]
MIANRNTYITSEAYLKLEEQGGTIICRMD